MVLLWLPLAPLSCADFHWHCHHWKVFRNFLPNCLGFLVFRLEGYLVCSNICRISYNVHSIAIDATVRLTRICKVSKMLLVDFLFFQVLGRSLKSVHSGWRSLPFVTYHWTMFLVASATSCLLSQGMFFEWSSSAYLTSASDFPTHPRPVLVKLSLKNVFDAYLCSQFLSFLLFLFTLPVLSRTSCQSLHRLAVVNDDLCCRFTWFFVSSSDDTHINLCIFFCLMLCYRL